MRVATLAQFNATLSNIQDAQARTAEAQIKISSGQKAQRYSGISGEARRLVSFEAAHLRTARFMENNQRIDGRLQIMETNISTIMDIATSLRADLISVGSGAGTGLQVDDTASQLLREMASLLNVSVEGRYLFGGGVTDRPPVDLDDPAFLPPGSTYPSAADTAYYQGDSTKLTTRADQNVEITYGMTADEPTFEKTIRALHLTATAVSGDQVDQARIDEALGLIGEAIDDLPDLIGRIGATRRTLENVNAKHDDFQLYTEQTIADIEAADITLTLAQISEDSTVLEASYATLGQLSRLSLLDYLR
ncbi:MAG: hypothetical protein HOH66_08920 [Rhodospirillaceae bacterium]|jgi:flagellar hook-associated protein 3 FlgL|nr:hypothetical protein [Rhodospirillaceae bacterium]MBT6117975.1 hypothetical protein [Rhodospirillaceae bacterium]